MTSFLDNKRRKSKRSTSRVSEYRKSLERLYVEHVKPMGPDLKPSFLKSFRISSATHKPLMPKGKRSKLEKKVQSASIKPYMTQN